MIVRGILKTLTDTLKSVRLFSATGRDRESFDQREFIQHYGFSSAPLAGAEMIIHVQGNIITAIASDDRRYRIALEDGDVAIWDNRQQKAHFTKLGMTVDVVGKLDATVTVETMLTCPKVTVMADEVTLNAGTVTCTGDLVVDGDVIGRGEVSDKTSTMQDMRNTFNNHTNGRAGLTSEPM